VDQIKAAAAGGSSRWHGLRQLSVRQHRAIKCDTLHVEVCLRHSQYVNTHLSFFCERELTHVRVRYPRSLYVVVVRPSVCLSVVCNVRAPY